MKSAFLTITPTGVSINGRYYTLSAGYQTAQEGMQFIPYAELLNVERVRRFSKRALLLFVAIGSVVVALTDFLGNSASIFTSMEDIVSVVTHYLLGLAIVFLLALLLTYRAYIEITFAGGVIRVPCTLMGKEISMRLVSEIQGNKEKSRHTR